MADPEAPAPRAPEAVPAEPTSSARHVRHRLLNAAVEENERWAKYRRSHEDFAKRGELISKAVPDLYFKLVKLLREGVDAFNATLAGHPEPRAFINLEESPEVTLKDVQSHRELRVRVQRQANYFDLILRFMSRVNRPPVPIIEGYGSFMKEGATYRYLMRIEGWVEEGQVVFWYSVDLKRIEMNLAELPDRILLALVKMDGSYLIRSLRAGESIDL